MTTADDPKPAERWTLYTEKVASAWLSWMWRDDEDDQTPPPQITVVPLAELDYWKKRATAAEMTWDGQDAERMDLREKIAVAEADRDVANAALDNLARKLTAAENERDEYRRVLHNINVHAVPTPHDRSDWTDYTLRLQRYVEDSCRDALAKTTL